MLSTVLTTVIILVRLKDRSPVTVSRITHENWLYVEQKGNAEVQEILVDFREGYIDKNKFDEQDGLLYHKSTVIKMEIKEK